MPSYSNVTLVGNLTRDPELKYTSKSNKAVCTVTVALNDETEQNKTIFVDVTCWEQQAEFLHRNGQKGSQVLIGGRLRMDQWEKDGQKRSKLGINASNVTLLSKWKQSNDNQAKEPAEKPATQWPPGESEVPWG